jgi:hypothetical protein
MREISVSKGTRCDTAQAAAVTGEGTHHTQSVV